MVRHPIPYSPLIYLFTNNHNESQKITSLMPHFSFCLVPLLLQQIQLKVKKLLVFLFYLFLKFYNNEMLFFLL